MLIVGGSLTGLAASLALARVGVASTVLERFTGSPASGSGMGLVPELFTRVTGVPAQRVPAVVGDRLSVAWRQVREALMEEVGRQPLVLLREGVDVVNVSAFDEVIQVETDAGMLYGDLVVGADGGRSTVRRWVAPDSPFAQYAGYCSWRALVDERDVPGGVERGDSTEFYVRGGSYLTAYCVPGENGSRYRGNRRACFSWYDGTRLALLRETGCVTADGHVAGTVYQSRTPTEVISELRHGASRWPSPWDRAIKAAIDAGRLFATPIAEYLPDRLVRGRRC